jgi:hypothetical protein
MLLDHRSESTLTFILLGIALSLALVLVKDNDTVFLGLSLLDVPLWADLCLHLLLS